MYLHLSMFIKHSKSGIISSYYELKIGCNLLFRFNLLIRLNQYQNRFIQLSSKKNDQISYDDSIKVD